MATLKFVALESRERLRMKSVAYVIRIRVVALAAALLVVSFTVRAQTAPGVAAAGSSPREINMLVLGDSILWGQGLNERNKSWYLVKTWLETTTGLTLREKVEAHAGAMIGSAGAEVPKSLTIHGEINSAYPTLHDQIDDAIRSYVDPSRVDLVLVDGCINDVNARRFLNAANSPEDIQILAREKCGEPVEQLLSRIASLFPNAHIVVSGYYPVMSERTPRDFFMRALAKRFYATTDQNAPKLSSKEMLTRLAVISAAWYEASNRSLSEAVARTSAQLAATGSRQRVLFAMVRFEPDHAFAARDSRLWGFDASFLRKLLVIFSLGHVNLTTNDEVSSQRSSVCRDFFRARPGETEDQKRQRKQSLMVCRLAAIAHPNRKGAVMYAEAIKQQIEAFLRSPGWLRTPAAAAADSH